MMFRVLVASFSQRIISLGKKLTQICTQRQLILLQNEDGVPSLATVKSCSAFVGFSEPYVAPIKTRCASIPESCQSCVMQFSTEQSVLQNYSWTFSNLNRSSQFIYIQQCNSASVYIAKETLETFHVCI